MYAYVKLNWLLLIFVGGPNHILFIYKTLEEVDQGECWGTWRKDRRGNSSQDVMHEINKYCSPYIELQVLCEMLVTQKY